MSDSSDIGVVDRNLKVHGTDNFFVAGSSVFPSGGHANPTLSIVQLSLRLGQHIKDLFKQIEMLKRVSKINKDAKKSGYFLEDIINSQLYGVSK